MSKQGICQSCGEGDANVDRGLVCYPVSRYACCRKKHKWMRNTPRRTGFVADATSKRAAFYEYEGKFTSEDRLTPDRPWEEVTVSFWAPACGGAARMVYALGIGAMTSDELIKEMERVQP